MKPSENHIAPTDRRNRGPESSILSPLGRKQLFFILLFSSLVTLLGTTVQLTIEYRNDVGMVHEQLDQIEKGYLQSLTHSLWKLDDAQIEIELNNMLSLRDVVALEIIEEDKIAYQAGEVQTDQKIIRRSYDMIYQHEGEPETIGRLHAVASLGGIYRRLGQRILMVLVTQGIKTFLVSFFILFVIHFMVTRHLVAMAKYVRQMSPENRIGGKLTLMRRGKTKDELDEVVRAINSMEKRVHDDIEKRKELETQLYQAHKMEAIGTMAGGIAHDFNNLLTIIMGNAELAVQSLPSHTDGRNHVEEIYKASLRAKDVVAQLLKFSRKMDSAYITIDPTVIVKEAYDLIKSSIPSHITIEQHIPEDIWAILADPTQMHQIILNLCTNAIHAMESQKGALRIRLLNTTVKDQYSQTNPQLPKGRYVLLEISDTGEGISKEHLDKIFDPYFSTKFIGKGTGMGLSVVHGMVTHHNGGIGIDSRPGQGTTVRVYLPASDSKSPADGKPETQRTAIKKNAQILLVDDEPQVAALGKKMLQKLGYTVEVTNDPEEAIEKVRQEPSRLDVLISDLSMPGMSGIELARKVHALQPDLPIILCSGMTLQVDPVEAEKAGISMFIDKPYHSHRLSEVLCNVLHCEYEP